MKSHKDESDKLSGNSISENRNDLSKEYLMAEYRYFSDSFWRNEEIGEKRVNFFITLVTAVIAALVALITKGGGTFELNEAVPFARVGLLALLLFGLVTLLRIIKRNQVTDEYKDILDKIRCYCKELDPETLKGYKPFGRDPCKEKKPKTGHRKIFSGGLVETVVAINCIIAAGFGYSLAIPCAKGFSLTYSLIGFAIALGAQILVIWIKTKPSVPSLFNNLIKRLR